MLGLSSIEELGNIFGQGWLLLLLLSNVPYLRPLFPVPLRL